MLQTITSLFSLSRGINRFHFPFLLHRSCLLTPKYDISLKELTSTLISSTSGWGVQQSSEAWCLLSSASLGYTYSLMKSVSCWYMSCTRDGRDFRSDGNGPGICTVERKLTKWIAGKLLRTSKSNLECKVLADKKQWFKVVCRKNLWNWWVMKPIVNHKFLEEKIQLCFQNFLTYRDHT